MTREEAIEMLKKDKEQRGNCFISDALDMAIKALEQEPCEDVVSRQAVIDEMERRHAKGDSITKGFVNNMPSVTSIRPKGHWQKIELPSRDAHECSECCGLALLDENNEQLTDFCPSCGADMRKSED